MRFMILVKASKDSEAGVMPPEQVFEAMAYYHEQLARAGALVDANGLQASSKGWRIEWKNGKQRITDGPFAEAKELIAGYTIINVASREEALEWTSRFPNPMLVDAEIEIRQMFELEDFGDGPGIERFREIGAGVRK
jgi:hypothetical protein